MLKEQKVPPGPRPTDFGSQSFRKENYNSTSGSSRTRMASGGDSTLSDSSQNKHSVFSFGGQAASEDNASTSTSYEFLPSVSFDDLHSSIESASSDLQLNQFPAPNGQGSIISNISFVDGLDTGITDKKAAPVRRIPSVQRPNRSGSLLRRQSTSTRQSSVSSTLSTNSGVMDPLGAQPAIRTRRQSQYPPISSNNATKAPRKSIGPGTIESDPATGASQRRRPSLTSSISTQSLSDTGTGRFERTSTSSLTAAADGARLATARARTKSLQPPSKQPRGHLSTPTMTPEHTRSSSLAGKSPGRSQGRGVSTPSSSARRMSVLPGLPTSASHATGLGARTISPTDARRIKRLSTLAGPPPVPSTPSTPQPDFISGVRPSSRSPSMLPRKSSTPSSLRTTPDVNRKSYCSNLSTLSNGSLNTARTSAGSLQQRLAPSNSTSRLPTPKSRNVHSSAGNEDEEVPPVPAIPKAYESPRELLPEQPLSKRKSSLLFDSSSVNSSSTNDLSGSLYVGDPIKPTQANPGKIIQMASGSDVDQKANAVPTKKKRLQPLRLPPLNLLPLSTPTAAKIAALHEPSFSDGNVTPPPKRGNVKTPSTPMTASKASFFSRNRHDDKADKAKDHIRSSSSVNHINGELSTIRNVNNASLAKAAATSSRGVRQTISPFVSPAPKSTGENILSSKGGRSNASDNTGERKTSKLTGPRAQKSGKPPKNSTPTQHSSPDDPVTPSSTSIRRKLSLGWRRSTSKSSISIPQATGERDPECPPRPPKHDIMPPPRLPASLTMNGLNTAIVPSPSPSVKSTTYLDSKRRKSSVSSLSMFAGHDRTRSDSWGVNQSPRKDSTVDGGAERLKPSASRTGSSVLSSVQKVLNSKPSASVLRPQDPEIMVLDQDDIFAEEEMKALASRRKETEQAARQLDALRKRATPKDRITAHYALQVLKLNIFERGEIIDYKDVYFCGIPNAAKHVGELQSDATNFGYDDERGDYMIVLGDHLGYRYEIVDILGKGSFGQVVRCVDHKNGALVAIKIIRNKKRFHQQALVEVNILQKLREWDPQNKHSMVNFTQSFYFRGHLCISTELLDMNLYEFIKSNGFRGVSLKLIRRFTKQLLGSLLLLKQHRVIHCDLKPENILLAHPMHSEIKVIDFGSSCFENEKVYTYIQSRFYRSPEVILGMTYGMPIDMWSVGCILAELYTGYPIFPGENEQEQLACIMEVFGPPEKHLIEKSTRKKLFFDSLGKPRITISSKGRRRKPSSKTLQQVLKCDDEAFIDFIARCLRWDPDRRMKPDEAIKHEFLTGQKPPVPASRSLTTRNGSPIKRLNTVTGPSGSRPLPEPPVSGIKLGTSLRTRDVAGTPSKSSAPRRQSTVGGQLAVIGNKRISTGLPRVTTRSSSARQDLASAGATAAMTRRA